MSEKPPTSPRTLAELNKKIIEIKKKIQLSEGQRKSAFEEFELERKLNADQILKLKKDIKELTVSLQENKNENAVHRIRSTRLESIVGPLVSKTPEQAKEILDLQITDRKKHVDLIRHKIKQRETYLAQLAKEYQTLLSKKAKKEVENIENPFKTTSKKSKAKKGAKSKKDGTVEMAKPYKKKVYALQNNIHRVEVQWREAEHIRNSYRAIRSALLKDSGAFESSLQQLEERLHTQQKEIQQLQKMAAEAASTRGAARAALEREERGALSAGRVRERQAAEQRGLVTERRAELERLERRIFQSGRTAAPPPPTQLALPPRPDTADDTERTGEDITPTEEDQDQEFVVMEAFEKLKDATGATSTDDVMVRFKAQRETKTRLDYLKRTTETDKRQLELKQETLINELDRYKFAQEKDKEKFSDEILELKKEIDYQEEQAEKFEEECREQENVLETICKILFNLYLGLKDIGIISSKELNANPENGHKLIESLQVDLEDVLKRSEKQEREADEREEEEELLLPDEELIPPSYSTLMRRTPLPLQGHSVQISSPVTVSDDEVEVPSRGFLKRQAQIVVDAKSRRKPMRVPMSRK